MVMLVTMRGWGKNCNLCWSKHYFMLIHVWFHMSVKCSVIFYMCMKYKCLWWTSSHNQIQILRLHMWRTKRSIKSGCISFKCSIKIWHQTIDNTNVQELEHDITACKDCYYCIAFDRSKYQLSNEGLVLYLYITSPEYITITQSFIMLPHPVLASNDSHCLTDFMFVGLWFGAVYPCMSLYNSSIDVPTNVATNHS